MKQLHQIYWYAVHSKPLLLKWTDLSPNMCENVLRTYMYKDFEYFDINILNILIEKAAAEDHLGWLNKLQKLLGADLQRNFIFYIFLFFYILLIICRSFSVKICRERAEGDGNALSTFFINCASDLHSNSTVDHCLSASTGALYVFMHTTTGDANNCLYIC